MSGNGRKPRPFRNNKSKAMNTWTAAKQQISKYGVTDLVNAGDLTIEHGALDTQMLGNPFREIRETPFHFWRSVVPRRRRYGAMHGSRQSSARRCNSPNRMIRPGVKAASDAGFGVAQATIIPKDL